MKKSFGLIGKKLGHSFSKNYFEKKFYKEQLNEHSYSLFELDLIEEIKAVIHKNPSLVGLNVTVPYKEKVMPFLDSLDERARSVGAVNTIKISEGKLVGYNTDIYGFERSLRNNTDLENINGALVLGTGGASKAVCYVLESNDIPYSLVSRKNGEDRITYEELGTDKSIIDSHKLIVNTTPLGMYPNVDSKPELPYTWMTKNHIFFDLVYNPELTAFLKEGKKSGAKVINGLEMLHLQAEKSWEIWNDL